MQTSSLDILENSRLLPQQAKAILQVMEQELAVYHKELATRADIADLKSGLNALEARLAHRFNGQLVALTGIFAGINAVFAGFIYFSLSHFLGR